uniref:Secreted RxLR effector protein 138 n=1 Tax=Plasmopara viticola TaxID=143451 RepID=RL138_PLAVT|nr:RecName: Full=Secreted RxLR effector protein 138; Flags: Precursor [Plasmopara viticola]
MRSAFYVAIVLLVAAGSQTAAKCDQDEPQHAPSNNFMASFDRVDQMLPSQVLQASRNLKDDFMFSAGDEERTPLAPSKLLKKVKFPDSVISTASAMRTTEDVNAIEIASKNLNQLRSNKRQRIVQTPNKMAGQAVVTPPALDIPLVSVANEKSLKLPKRRTRKRPTAVVENAARSVPQHDYHSAPQDSFKINAEAPNARLYNQLITQKALQLEKNEHLEKNAREEELVSFDLLHLFEKSAHPAAGNRQEANAIKVASKNLIQLESNTRKRNNVVGQVKRKRPNRDRSPVSVANGKPLGLAKRRKSNHPTAVAKNAASSVKQHDHRVAPPEPSRLDAKALDGRINNQQITQKASQLDKNEHVDKRSWREELVSVDELMHLFDEFDKSAHPTTVSRQETSAIEATSKSLIPAESSTHKGIALTSNDVVEVGVHAPPDPDKFLVLVADNMPMILAERLKTTSPTAIMNNAARFVTQHYERLAHLESSTTNAEALSGRLINQPITQKALQLDKSQHVDDVEDIEKQFSRAVGHFWHLREVNDKSAHTTAVYRQTVPDDWNAEYAKGPKTLSQDGKINNDVKEVHAAFLEAFNLPFHQYPQETAIMLKIVQRKNKSSPNNFRTFKTFKLLAQNQMILSHLQELLAPDLKKLLGYGNMALPITLKNLKEALNVKLVIMYDLFIIFCHERVDLVKDLPPKPTPSQWIFEISTLSSGNKNRQVLPPHD